MKHELDFTRFLFVPTTLLHMLHFAELFLTRELGLGFSFTSPDKIKLYEATEFA